MARKLYLHLGLHKTATSSFQNSCARNQDRLEKQGYAYTLFSCGQQQIQPFENHSIPLYSLFCARPQHYPVNVKLGITGMKLEEAHERYKEQLHITLSTSQDVILSGEDIPSLATQELENLLEYLENFEREIIPVVAVRQPYTYHCSQLQQQIKDGKPMIYWNHCPQKERIEKLIHVFDKGILFVNFEESCKHPKGPAAYLMEVLGINTKGLEFTGKNKGRCNENIRMQNTLNVRQPSILDGRPNPRHIKVAPFSGKPFRLTTQEFECLSPHWQEPNRKVSLEAHLVNEAQIIKQAFGHDWEESKPQTREATVDDTYPAATYALLMTIGFSLQQARHPITRSLPIQTIHQSLITSGPKLLKVMQAITYSHIENLLYIKRAHAEDIRQDLKDCGIPDSSATALISAASTWINRQKGSLQ